MLSLSPRQQASAFNQPLSWDTSSVTNMYQMFYVRSARAPASRLDSFGSSARTLLAAASACTLLALPPRPRPPASWPACRRSFYALPFDSRQNAYAFNQPLSWDTSSVKDMYRMFYVRSARAPASGLHTWVLCLQAACAAAAPTPSRLHARLSPLVLCFPFRLGSPRMRSTSR